jgi:thiamine monophosphate kinase
VNEFELIDRLTGALPTNASVVAGAGDDCAVIEGGRPGHYSCTGNKQLQIVAA